MQLYTKQTVHNYLVEHLENNLPIETCHERFEKAIGASELTEKDVGGVSFYYDTTGKEVAMFDYENLIGIAMD